MQIPVEVADTVVTTWESLLVPTSPTETWAMATFFANVAVAVVAYLGLRSLTLSKKDMLDRAKREARTEAVRKCIEFGSDIIPLNGEVSNQLLANRVPVFVLDAEKAVFGETDDPSEVKRAVKWVESLPPDLQNLTIRLLNRLEVWAMPFAHQLADHDIAFEPCARVYCQIVIQYYPSLLALRRNTTDGKFRNVIAVYDDWSTRLLSQDKSKQAQILLSEVSKYQSSGMGLKPPIGVQD